MAPVNPARSEPYRVPRQAPAVSGWRAIAPGLAAVGLPKRTHCDHIRLVRLFDWDDEKNEWLRENRGIAFEDVIYHVTRGDLLDTIEHPNQNRYPGQRIFVVNVDGYVFLVPFVEDDDTIFLKTIIPSRRMTRQYIRRVSE